MHFQSGVEFDYQAKWMSDTGNGHSTIKVIELEGKNKNKKKRFDGFLQAKISWTEAENSNSRQLTIDNRLEYC